MSNEIKVDLTKQEQIILHAFRLVNLNNEILGKVQLVMANLPSLSSQGAFHDLIATSDSNLGMALFVKKAQEFGTISEILYKHVQNTYNRMGETDKGLAVGIAELILSSPDRPEEEKQAIRENPEEAISYIQKDYRDNLNSAKEAAEQQKSEGGKK